MNFYGASRGMRSVLHRRLNRDSPRPMLMTPGYRSKQRMTVFLLALRIAATSDGVRNSGVMLPSIQNTGISGDGASESPSFLAASVTALTMIFVRTWAAAGPIFFMKCLNR
jgi:hypothetical protein